MKTKNIFRMLLVAALLMGANNVKAAVEGQIWPANGADNTSNECSIGNQVFIDAGVSDGTVLRVYCGKITGGGGSFAIRFWANGQNPEFKAGIEATWETQVVTNNQGLINDSYIDLTCSTNTATKLKAGGFSATVDGITIKNVAIVDGSSSGSSGSSSTLHAGENIVWQGQYGPQWFNNDWKEVLYIPTEKFKAASDGDVVRVYGTFNSNWAVEFKTDTDGWPLISEWVKADGTKCNQANAGTVGITDLGNGVKYIEFPLTTTFIESINYDNFVIQGVNFCVDKVVIYVEPSYTINYTVDDTTHGNFASGNPTTGTPGNSVSFYITSVDDGYTANVTATYGDNNTPLTLTLGTNGQYSFTMPDGDVTVTLSFREIITINRTIGTYGAITFSSEVPVAIPDGITAYYAKEVSNNKVVMMEITGIIPSETGVVLFGNEGNYDFTMADSEGTIISNNLLRPVLETTGQLIGYESSQYVLTWHDRLVFALTSSDNIAIVEYGQAYLDLDGVNAGSRLRISFKHDDDDLTGIQSLQSDERSLDRAVYNLRGQRVEHPTKGIYIINGKKVIIK